MYRKEDIEKLVSNRCSLNEATKIILFLDKHPEILANYFTLEEWESFKYTTNIDTKLSNKLWFNVKHNTIKPKATVFYLRKFSVAASIIFILGIGIWSLILQKNFQSTNINLNNSNLTKIDNESRINKTVILPDSSVVVLYPNSSLIYNRFIFRDKRDIKLSGEGVFSVKKDSLSPFTVYSDVITTKVLGTKFRVQAYGLDNLIKITLYEGKVVVNSLKGRVKAFKRKIYMIPGDIFEYNKKMSTSLLKHYNKGNQIGSKNIDDANSSTNWYMFNNQKLPEVLDQLGILYDEKIVYDKNDLNGMSFIGKLDKTDSLQHILNSICLLNNLVVVKETNGYRIIKSSK